MNTVVKKYGAGIFGFLIVILTAISSLQDFNLVTILQVVALGLTTLIQVGIVGILPGKWPGAAKTLIDLAGAGIALALPYAIAGHITWQEVGLVIVGIIKAAATEFGVWIRTDQLIEASGSGTVNDPAVITSVRPTVNRVPIAHGAETPGTVTSSSSQ